jgi:hypothetical protein
MKDKAPGGGEAVGEQENAARRDSEGTELFAQLDGDDLAVDGLVCGLSVLDFC